MNIYDAHSQTNTMTLVASFLAIAVVMVPLFMALGVSWIEDKLNRRENE